MPASLAASSIAAYAPRLADGQFFSHQTAAKLYGMPLPRPLETDQIVHVSAIAPNFPPRARGVTGHRFRGPIDLRTVQGMLVPAPASTWCQLAELLGEDELVVVGDHLLRRKLPLCSRAELQHAAVGMGSARGARAIRNALTRVRAGTDLPMETRLRLLLIAHGLPEPAIQHSIIDADGFFVATPDLAYVEARIAIEYEGRHHQTDARVYAEDIERRALIEGDGWKVILVIADHLRHPEWLANRVRSALIERTRTSIR